MPNKRKYKLFLYYIILVKSIYGICTAHGSYNNHICKQQQRMYQYRFAISVSEKENFHPHNVSRACLFRICGILFAKWMTFYVCFVTSPFYVDGFHFHFNITSTLTPTKRQKHRPHTHTYTQTTYKLLCKLLNPVVYNTIGPTTDHSIDLPFCVYEYWA